MAFILLACSGPELLKLGSVAFFSPVQHRLQFGDSVLVTAAGLGHRVL